MFPTFSFFVRSILSSSALAASVPSAKSFFRFSSSSASRCWRFSRCSRIMRLLSMFGWKLSSSSESSIRSHLLSADAHAKSQCGVCAGPSRRGAEREQDKLTSGSQFVKDMARPAERVVGEAAGSRANDASDASRPPQTDAPPNSGVEAPERFACLPYLLQGGDASLRNTGIVSSEGTQRPQANPTRATGKQLRQVRWCASPSYPRPARRVRSASFFVRAAAAVRFRVV